MNNILSPAYFLGIDMSTTATKALLIDQRGQVLGVASREYPSQAPRPLWSEQDPALWWNATLESVRALISESRVEPSAIQCIGLTGQMHGLVSLNEEGQVLRPAILWNDQRTGAQCQEIRQRLGKSRLIEITGNDALTGFTAPKILWVQQNEPEVWKNTRHILLPKDYLRYRLTGELATDRSDGSGTLLFDLRRRDWSAEMLAALEIPLEYLPQTYEGTDIVSFLAPEVASQLNLPAGIPLVGGAGDQAASAVGSGAVREGVVSLSLGTSGVIFAATDAPVFEPDGRLHAFCHAVPGMWHLMGVTLSAGGSLRWLRDTVSATAGFEELVAPAGDITPGSEGLLFLPYLTGERTPHADPLARGAFVGLTVRHTLSHMTRAVLEGVAFGVRDSLELIESAGLGEIKQVRITGGGASNPIWRQILADVLGVELVTLRYNQGSAYGAALLAATGAGAFPDVGTACDQLVKITGSTTPSAAQAAYREIYPIYRGLYPALKNAFNELTIN
jgi:xylulokinase